MKVKLFLIFLLLLSASQTNAQALINYGLKGAVSSSFQQIEPFYKYMPYKRYVGFNAGIFSEWFNHQFLSLVAQLEYRQVGMGVPFGNTDSNGTVLRTYYYYSRFDYLSLPLFLKIRKNAFVSTYLFIGPRFDFLLGYKTEDAFITTLFDKYEKTILGGSFGLGFETNMTSRLKTYIEFRYNHDFTDTYNDGFLKINNNAYDLWVGVGF
jgi:hypothetical protein